MNIKRWHLNLWIQQCSSQSPVPLASLLLADSELCLRVLVGTRHEVATQSSPRLSLQLRHPLPEKKTPRRCPAFAAARHGCQCPCPRALSSVTPKLSVLRKPSSHGMSGSPNPGTTLSDPVPAATLCMVRVSPKSPYKISSVTAGFGYQHRRGS